MKITFNKDSPKNVCVWIKCFSHDSRYRGKYDWYDTRLMTTSCGHSPVPSY